MNYLPDGFSKSRTVAGTGARCSLVHLTTSITSTSVFKLGLSNREFHREWSLAIARFSRLPPVPSRHPRGLTRGLKVQAMVQKDGKLKGPIPQEYRAPIQAKHCFQPDVVPITPEELSVKVLKPRSGYVKGLRLRRSFSVRTTSASTGNDYVRHLEMEIQEQKEEIQSQKEEIQSQKEEIVAQKHEIQVQKEEIQAQNKEIGKMNGSIDEHFEITSSIMEFLKKQGFSTSTWHETSFMLKALELRPSFQ
ncbi:hypothetical protein TEA_006357 [Camellia sinensis var. sinensis]|uniref:Uncharacterized protein n=1 Tax=Camellia sinensis var. sinensis TaxID=542762 RepID=A0A4S4DTV6_CAMSN|nr:hypothetical protein TEA_006357 [Camellia sinensis var. sinensis]